MTDKLFTTLIPKVHPSVPGCPQPLLLQHIRDTAIRVCERTLAWRYEVPKFALTPGVHEYPYPVPAGRSVHAILGAIINDSPLEHLTLDQALARYPEWADLFSGESATTFWSETGPHLFNTDEFNEEEFNAGESITIPDSVVADGATPHIICQVRPDRFVLLPMPDEQEYILRLFVALKPTKTATGMDEYLLDELEDTIVHGALQHLCAMPQVSWTDRELAAYHAKQYLFHLSERRARANLGNARGVMVFQPSRAARWA